MAENTKISDDEILSAFKSEQAAASEPVYTKEEAKGIPDEAILSAFKVATPEMQTAGGTLSGGGGLFQPEMIGSTAPAEQSALVVSGPLGSGKFSTIPVGPKGKFDEYAGITDPDTRKGIAETVFKNITDPRDLKELQEKVPWYDISENPTQVKSLFLHEWNEKTDPFELVGSAAKAGVGMLQSLPPLVAGAGRLAKDALGAAVYVGDPSAFGQAKTLTEQQRKGLSEQQIRDAELSPRDKTIRAARAFGDAALEAEEQLRTAAANFAENKSMLWDKAKVGFASAPDYGDFSGLTATPETEQEAQARRAAKTAELMEEAEKNFAARLNAKHVEYLHREKNPAVLARDIEAVWKYPAVKTFAANVMELMMPPAEDAAPGFGGDMQAAKANRRAQAIEAAEVGVQAAIAEANRLREDPEQVGAIAMTTPLNVVGAGAMLFGGLSRASQALARGLKAIGKTDQEINALFSAELAAARAQAEAAALAREQPGRLEQALGSTADTFDKAKAAFAQVPLPAQYIGMAGLGGLAGAVTADDPLTGFLEGAGTGAAGRLGMKLGGGALLAAPRLGQELIKAGRLAGAEMGRFEALERLGSASPEVQRFVNWSQKVGGGKVMDFIEKNANVFVQHNVSMLPMMVALGVLEDKDAKEFAQMWAEFATYGFIHGQVLGGILGNDPVRMRMDREANMRQAQRVINSLSPESRENVRNLTWDRVIEQSEARVEQARAAAEAQLAADPNSPEAAEAQADYNFATQLHRQNLIAPPEARAAFEDGIRLSLAQASNLINGVLTPNSNMNIELLTTQQIYDKMIAANPNYNGVGAPLTIEQAMAMNPGADGAKIGKGISDSGFVMDAAKDTVFVNLDNALVKGRLSGEAIPNVIAHEVVGHGLFGKEEYRQKIAPLYNKMFGTEAMDENGNWQQITPAQPGLSREDLLEKFFNKYLEGKTPESVAQYAEAAGVWDKANNTFNNNNVVELMREEVLAEAHAGRFYGNPESPLQRGIGWLASRISGNNLKAALNHLYSVAGPAVYAQWTSGVTGATYSPEVMRAIRNVERQMKQYDGEFIDAEAGEAVAAPITKKDVIKSKEMLQKYYGDTGKFETTPVAVVTDAEGNVVQSVKLTDNEAFEGSWNYQQNEATGDNVPNRESGFGDIPAELVGIQVPVGGRLQVQRQIAYDEATGKPIERKNKATVEYLKRRVQMLRDAIDNAGDPSQLGRFRAIKGGQGKDDEDLHYTGKMTPEQRSAIAALPESVVPSSIKELLLKYDDLMTRGDGTVLDIDYASRLNDKGNYQAFSPKIRQIVPLQLHLSKAGNFYTTAWDISDLRRKVRLYEKYAKGVFEPWGGDIQKFWNEFRTILLPNLTNPDPNVPGWQGLDADPNIAKLKRTIYAKMLGDPNPNIPDVESIPDLPREKFSRSERKLDKQSSFDQIIKSFRLDSVTAAEENANSEFKYPIPYKARFMPEQEAAGTGAQMRFQPEGEDPTNVAPGFYSKAGRLLLGKMGGRASAEQLKRMLDPQKGSGVKPDELKWSGINQFIDATQAEKGFVTREDINKFLTENYAAKFETKTMRQSRQMSEYFEFYSEDPEWGDTAKFETIEEAVDAAQQMFGMNESEAEEFVFDTNEAHSAYAPNETEYSSYTLPGGENYKEIVLQVPGTGFVSSHFSDVPDYIAHLRTAEHGNGLLIEEIQSDLHQKAREKGYKEPVPLEETLRELDESLAAAKDKRSKLFEERKRASAALREMPSTPRKELSDFDRVYAEWLDEKIANYPKEIDSINAKIEATEKEIEDYTFGRKVKTRGEIPDAPFRKDWPLQLFKYALKDAIATGKEWIGWTGGEKQAERYDLSEQVDKVSVTRGGGDKWEIWADKDGQVVAKKDADTIEEVAAFIGKDLAKKVEDMQPGAGVREFSGVDLKVGGEGMKGFYDVMLPKEIGKYVKQWGAKVEPGSVEGKKEYIIQGNPNISPTMTFTNRSHAVVALNNRGRGEGGEVVEIGENPKIWKIAITPEMRESVAGGQARFMPGTAELPVSKFEDEYRRVPSQEELDAMKAKLPKYSATVDVSGNRDNLYLIKLFDESDNQIGYAHASRNPKDPTSGLEVESVHLEGDYRGKGYGQALYREIAKLAQGLGISKLTSSTTSRLAANARSKILETNWRGAGWDAESKVPSDIRFMPEQPAVDEQAQQTRINEPGRKAEDIGVRPDETRNRGGQRTARGYSPLAGAPNVYGRSGPIEKISDIADRYADSRGIAVRKQAAYAEADVERGRRIAEEYSRMPHDPQNPRVQEAYADLIRQSADQYKALAEEGYKAWFIDPANDPYEGKPWKAMRDLRENESMGVFPTESGFGSGDTDIVVSDNPLLGDSGLKWPYGSPDGPLKRVLWNDVFRYIHDAFGHGIEGAGFRADGEENAWQAHVRLFTGPAVGAMTSETRGQNSWLNFGPHAEKNKTASVEETVFADQKTGLMPEWTWNEGVVPDEPLLERGTLSDIRFMPAAKKKKPAKQKKAAAEEEKLSPQEKSAIKLRTAFVVDEGDSVSLPILQETANGKPKLDKNKEPKIIKLDYNLVDSPEITQFSGGVVEDPTKPDWEKLAYDVPAKFQKVINAAIDSGAIDNAANRAVEKTARYLQNPEIAAGKGWYSRMRDNLLEALGEEKRELLSQLLGATSAKTPVNENFLQAMDALEGIVSGRYDSNRESYLAMLAAEEKGELNTLINEKNYVATIESKIKQLKKEAKKLTGKKQQAAKTEISKLEELIAIPEEERTKRDRMKITVLGSGLMPLRSNGKKFNANSMAVMKVIAGTWLDNRSAPKTPNFAGNLSGRTVQATIDVWAARFLRQLLYENSGKPWRIQPKSETGVSNEDFALGQLIMERAAKKLDMNPDDLQAVLWFAEKDNWEKQGWTKSIGAEKSSFDEIFHKFFPKGKKPLSFQEAIELFAKEKAKINEAETEEVEDGEEEDIE